MLTKNEEDYLRAIYIMEERGSSVKSINLADYLKVSKPSVSEMMQRLSSSSMVSYKKYSGIKFTAKGRRIARNLTVKHRVIELFLKNIIKMSSAKIHLEADRLEHAFSDESVLKLRKLLGNPKKDPHGKLIPG